MIKYIVCDLDGTLLKGHQERIFDLTQINRDAIKRCKQAGIKFIIASGRGYQYGKKILELYFDEEDIIVCGLNGCIYYDHEEISNSYLIDLNDAKEMWTLLQANPTYYLNFQIQTPQLSRFYNEINDDICLKYNSECDKLQIGEKCFTKIEDAFKQNLIKEVGKVSIRVDSEEASIQLEKILKERFAQKYEINRSSYQYLEINHKSATKGNFILYLMDKYHLRADEIACIGDSHNDNSMLELVTNSFCMQSGDISTLNVAKYHVSDVSEAINACIDKINAVY